MLRFLLATSATFLFVLALLHLAGCFGYGRAPRVCPAAGCPMDGGPPAR